MQRNLRTDVNSREIQYLFLIKKKKKKRVPVVAQWVKNPTSIHVDVGLILSLGQ